MKKNKLIVIMATILAVASCAYVDHNSPKHFTKKKAHTVQQPTFDPTIGIEEYDEDAIEDYMDGMKGVVQFLNAAQTADSVVIMQGQMLLGLTIGKMKTSKVEIDFWPYGARKKAWDIKGSRLQKYNKLVNEESARILNEPSFSPQLKKIVKSISLITKESLLAK